MNWNITYNPMMDTWSDCTIYCTYWPALWILRTTDLLLIMLLEMCKLIILWHILVCFEWILFIFFNSQHKWNKNLFKKMHIIFMRSWNRNGKRFGSCISLFSKNNKFPCYQRSTQVIYMHFCCINHYNHLVWYDIDTRAYEGRWFFCI